MGGGGGGGGGGLIWPVAMYKGEYNLKVTHSVSEFIRRLVSNSVYAM